MGKTEKIILFQGDSITDGGRLKGKENAWDLNHQMGHGYAFLINAAMGCRYPEKNLRFYNRGVSGNRVGDLYGRWMEDTICLKPDILSVMVGINDCGSTLHDGAGSSPARFEKIYQLMLEEARQAAIKRCRSAVSLKYTAFPVRQSVAVRKQVCPEEK